MAFSASCDCFNGVLFRFRRVVEIGGNLCPCQPKFRIAARFLQFFLDACLSCLPHFLGLDKLRVADAYVSKLKAAGKEVETYFPENGPHSICFRSWNDVGPVTPETKECVRLTTAFIKKHFDKVPK